MESSIKSNVINLSDKRNVLSIKNLISIQNLELRNNMIETENQEQKITKLIFLLSKKALDCEIALKKMDERILNLEKMLGERD